MIPVSILIEAFRTERDCLKRNTDATLYCRGIIQGLRLAEAITKLKWKQCQNRMINNPKGITNKRRFIRG